MNESLTREIERRAAAGAEQLTVPGLAARFAALGYRLDRSADCRSAARIMTGPGAGDSYPNVSPGLREIDSGLSAWNNAARRDNNFYAMQALRSTVYAISRGAILDV